MENIGKCQEWLILPEHKCGSIGAPSWGCLWYPQCSHNYIMIKIILQWLTFAAASTTTMGSSRSPASSSLFSPLFSLLSSSSSSSSSSPQNNISTPLAIAEALSQWRASGQRRRGADEKGQRQSKVGQRRHLLLASPGSRKSSDWNCAYLTLAMLLNCWTNGGQPQPKTLKPV